ncbi:threonine--tRNA ligase [Sulfurospirillum sp. T05]|uniref:Threonine--tRNA ligase n=2 Tax=Sulfurospirillum tamanense TaxID=2813362 RepID=A0ABS2WQY4_9BACT|nr:threonine--tRNA ligase [Sulfurospirillum tamanensis]MBN2964045.1 threonine--tRNA ligase [Sulfurospirillum tamanensis]
MSEPIAYLVDGMPVDTQTVAAKNLQGSPLFFDNSEASLELIRHSTAHLMAHAIKRLYPEAKFFVGPVIEDGFYYDFRVAAKITEAELKTIEKTMLEILKEKHPIERYELTKAEVSQKFVADDLKQEVLKRIPEGGVSIYKQGDFEDICRGPHVPNVNLLRFFKLTRVSGAYLGGDETREMLTRIYGTAFADKETLKEHLAMIEEAKKRDHRKLGNELKLFTFDEEIGAGLPIWLPNGSRLRSKLEHLLFAAHRKRGYQPVRGPELLKADAWKTSGHYDNYGENMYFTVIDEMEYGIKPMNCVGHVKVFQSDVRSYRDLPLKFFEYGVVHRHEKSGVMHGLFRVREFTQDDAHVFCTPEQIKENVIEILDFVDQIMKSFGFTYEMEISTKPAKAIGDDAVWEKATQGLKDALDEHGFVYGIDEGGGAFYGPKIDIKITDALKRKWQCGTIQVDFNLPSRFELSYIDQHNERAQPVMIHRAILGSFERFIGILIEHTGGEFPFFIAPTQVVIVPIGEEHHSYAKEVARKLLEQGIDAEVSAKNESLNKRIRTAEKQRVPMIVVVGEEEVKNQSVALRDRRERMQSTLSLEELLAQLKEKMSEVRF